MTRVVLRAHLLKSVGPGQRYLMEREWHDDGRVLQRVNAGEPVKENDWQTRSAVEGHRPRARGRPR